MTGFIFSTDRKLLEVVESIIEIIDKQKAMAQLEEVLGSEIVVAVNTVFKSVVEDSCAYVSSYCSNDFN